MNTKTNKINLGKCPDLLFEKTTNNVNNTPVYGPFKKLYLSDWGQSNINKYIVQALSKMNIRQMRPIQKNAFLYLMNNYNTAMVGFSKGKSISYLISIFSLIMNNTCNDVTKEAIGPIAIVLTNSSGSCCELEILSKQLNFCIKDGNNIGIVVADVSTPARNVEAALCNGCKILITTPTYLNNLLKKSKLFSWTNLRHFVFDNIDLLLEHCREKVVDVFLILKKMKDKTDTIQFISTSVRWTKDVDEFLKNLFVKWQYIFGSHLEAAHYMKIGFNFVPVKNNKLEIILQYLKNNIKYGRSVLMTSNSDELHTIYNYIHSDNSDFEIILANQLKSAQCFTIQEWNSPLKKNHRLLICSDEMMFDYYIFDADCLIHYDIPVGKHTFSIRFSVLQDSNTVLKEKNRSTYIFLSDSCKDMLQIPKVVDVMKTFGNGELDPNLLKNAKIINDSLEKAKINSLFCNKIEQFGYCPNQSSCKYRHILSKEIDDAADNIPKSGLAIIKILNVYDASHMSVKLLKLNHTNNLNDQNWSNIEDNSTIIKNELNSFYSNPLNKTIFENPKPGDIIAVELDIKFREVISPEYFRAIVVDLIDLSPINLQVRVKLIDEGFEEIVSKWKIFVLFDKLKNMQTYTLDMYISSVKPIELDKVWYTKANTMVKKRLKLAENCSDTIIVKVKLALRNTIWVSKLYRKYWNSELKIYDFEAILPDLLINFGYADLNADHFEKLTELCSSANIYLPQPLRENIQKDNKLSKEEFMLLYKLPQPQWAHLELNVDALVSVDFIISPKCFFVRNSKFYECLNDLNIKINNYVEQKQVEELKHIVEGTFCLAKYPPTNQYGRVQICEILNETNEYNETLVEVFFVDIGDFRKIASNSFLVIHPNLITQLPFQAIECSLNSVKEDALPLDNELEELNDFMFNLTQNLLYSKVINTTSSQNFSSINYEIILYDEHSNINLELYEKYNQYFDYNEIVNQINNQYVDDKSTFDENKSVDSKELMDQIPPFDLNAYEADDMDPEDLIPQQQLLDELGLALFGQNYKLLKENHEPAIEECDNKSPNHDIVKESATQKTSIIPDTEKNLKDCTFKPIEKTVTVDSTKIKIMEAQQKSKSKSSIKRRIMCLTCNNYVQSIVPICIWYQDVNNIFLKFNILEIDNFCVDCTAESITFKAQFKDTSYSFYAKLFGLIIDQNVTHKLSHGGFHIKAEKLYKTDYNWPRLFMCNKWHKYIQYDPEHIEPKNLYAWINGMKMFKMKALQAPLIENDVITSDNSDYDDGSFNDDLMMSD